MRILSRIHAALAAGLVVPVLLAAAASDDWPSSLHDLSGQRYSSLKQITPANVATLATAWSFDTEAGPLQTIPIVAGGMLYLTGARNVFALEPETGKPLWKFTAASPVSRRGVSYWPGNGSIGPRLFTGAGDRLIALDAKTGKPAIEFGENGSIDLATGVRGEVNGGFSLASAPAVYRNMVITGGNNGEQQPSLGLYGDIRAWDAATGKLLWTFHTVPRAGEPGVETWEGESWKNRSGTNMWAYFTIDEARGLLFAPIGSPTSDYYGGDRKGKNLYGNSIVALDVNTGKLKWYQQLVHHDLWDFDVPAAPTLFDVKREGRTIPAVGVITKMSTLFIFNRETGAPIYGMEERPVPQSDVPGEASWPTQPFPVKPPPLARTTFDPAKDFNTLTPEVGAFCKDLWEKNKLSTKGMFTPAGPDGFMVTFPSTIGGGNWNGLSYDPSLGYVFTNVMDLGQVGKMVKGTDRGGQSSWLRTTPWGGAVGRFWNPADKIPCSAPPFGELVAVNVNTGEIAWKVPLGIIEELKSAGFPTTGAPNLGGSIATASGLIFVGATNDAHFRAFESKTGTLLWDTELEASAHGLPITYLGKDGRQYVAVAAGGGSYLGSPAGTRLVAFALPTAATITETTATTPTGAMKHVLAWADVRNGYQHEAISHAMATIERLGRQSGLYDTYIRTDSQLITRHPITFKTGTGIATGEQFLAHNLNYFDAIFFFGVREIDLTDEQKADLMAFVKDDGKGFVAAHSGATAFFSWPEFGEMLGGRFDEHPWGITEATVVVDDPAFPAMQGFPMTSVRTDEHYQLKDFSREKVRVLAHLDAARLDLHTPLVHRTDGDFPVAWAHTYGKGRVFYSTLGHVVESWDDPVLEQMYFNAMRWALGLTPGDATPQPRTGSR